MLAADRVSWQNPRVLVTLLLVFLAGALAGAIAMRSPLHAKMHATAAPYWGDDKREFSYDTLNKELKLSPEQSDRLKTILDDFVKYHDDLEAQIEDVRATGQNRIRQMLNPQQQQRFDELCKRLPSQ
jgi:Spy/CpxP family protein refolding chaperone